MVKIENHLSSKPWMTRTRTRSRGRADHQRVVVLARRGKIWRCTLWYYKQYYGASARQASTDPHKEVLQPSSHMSNRHLRVGDITHLVIRT